MVTSLCLNPSRLRVTLWIGSSLLHDSQVCCLLDSSVLWPHWPALATHSGPGLSPGCPLCPGHSSPHIFAGGPLMILHQSQCPYLPEANRPQCPGSHPFHLLGCCPATLPSYSHIFHSSLSFRSFPSIHTHAGPFSSVAKGAVHAHPGYSSNNRWGALFKGKLQQPHWRYLGKVRLHIVTIVHVPSKIPPASPWLTCALGSEAHSRQWGHDLADS